MFERFAQSARVAVDDARYEAARRGDRRIGTDHLLMALLAEDGLARAVGVDAQAAHGAADELDRQALAAVGVGLGGFEPSGRASLSRRTPVTAGVKDVLRETLATAAAERARTISSRHMLLALLERREPDPAAALLSALGVDRAAVRERLAAA